MSKIGQKIINVPEGVSVSLENNQVVIKGPLGQLNINLPSDIELEIKDKTLSLKRKKETNFVKSLHGLYRQLIANAIYGVQKYWEKKLEIVGTGYNVKMEGENLVFKIGYSHSVFFKKVEGIKFELEGNTKIKVLGCDKQKVGEVAYQIKMLKKPDVYKGKGIRYEGEKLRIKPGKKAKATTGTN